MPTGFEKYPKLYGSPQWRHTRLAVLDRDLFLCQQCLRMGKETLLTVSSPVHHKTPHRGNRELFFDKDNLEAVCNDCHDSIIQMEEKYGYSQACGVDGYPISQDHPFNRKR